MDSDYLGARVAMPSKFESCGADAVDVVVVAWVVVMVWRVRVLSCFPYRMLEQT